LTTPTSYPAVFMDLLALRLDNLSDPCLDFVAELAQEALADAEREPDGFSPFTAVLYLDGTQRRRRYEVRDDPEGVLELAHSELGDTGESARCVAVVWDGYIVRMSGRTDDAVHVEAYELGRPGGHILAMAYIRDRRGISVSTEAWHERFETEPIVPLTVESMRRHLDEWTDRCRADLRELVDQLYGDAPAFDDDPHACVPVLEEWLSDLPFGELDTEDAVALLAPVARYVAEVLIRVHWGRWDVTSDGENLTHVVVVGGDDGQSHQLDPFALVREYADAPLPPLSTILREALDRVHR